MRPFYAIPQLTQPLESYCEMYNAFSPEECKKIIDLGGLLLFAAGSVGSNIVKLETRDSTVAWIDDNPQATNLTDRQWVINAMANAFAKVNLDKFNLDLDGFAPIQFTKYALNQHYDWHTDSQEGLATPEHRKLSASLILSGPDDYEGGELELNLTGNPEDTKLLRPAAGTIVFFYSHIPHRVRPVTKGDRTSLVAWALGPKMR